MKRKLTPAFVQKPPLPEKGDRLIIWDTAVQGFGLVVQRSGKTSYCVQYRHKRRSRRMTIPGVLSLDEARKRAKKLLGQVANDHDPLQERRSKEASAANTLKSVCEEYITRTKADGSMRSIGQREAILERLVYPKQIAARQIEEVTRLDITRLLDSIADERGPTMADGVLAVLRKIFNWHATRTDSFRSPIIQGMARTKPAERARERTLADAEIRKLWLTAEKLQTPFARMLQLILLTGVRRNEAAGMDRSELEGDDEWMIPGPRMKAGLPHLVPLTPQAEAIINSLPVIGSADRGPVFTASGARPLTAFGYLKAEFDRECGVTDYTIHDLRRTARTLLSQAGVLPDHAERVLAHKIGGVRGVYDKYAFRKEKRDALERLAALIERIINPPADNVVPLKEDNRIPA
jgi:integrase